MSPAHNNYVIIITIIVIVKINYRSLNKSCYEECQVKNRAALRPTLSHNSNCNTGSIMLVSERIGSFCSVERLFQLPFLVHYTFSIQINMSMRSGRGIFWQNSILKALISDWYDKSGKKKRLRRKEEIKKEVGLIATPRHSILQP